MAGQIQGLSIPVSLTTIGVNTGLTQLRAKMRLLNSETKANLSVFDRGEKSLGRYEASLEGVNKKLELQRVIADKARQTYDKMVEVHGEGSVKAQNAAKDFNNESARLQDLTRDANKAAQELHDFTEEQRQSSSIIGQMSTKLNEMGSKLTSVGDKMKSMGQTLSLSVTAPIVGLGAAAAKTSIEFEAQMSKVGAISGATAGEMDKLKESALSLGASTSKSASEVAKGQEGLAAMGFTVKDILGAMPGVISAAEASGADMAQTADVMASSLNIFGLKASEASRVADVLAQTANQSAADITDMQYALKYAGPPAAALGVSLEETSAAIGIMTNAGMQGEQAGTTLRGALLGLLDPSEKNSKLMNRMGIEITDASGNFVGISKLIKNMSTALKDQTETQKAATISSLVGKEAVSGMLSLMKAGPKEIDKMTKGLENAGGSSATAAAKMKDNLKGALDEMSGSFETAGIKIGEIMTPALTKLAGVVQSVVQKFISAPPILQKTMIVVAGIAAAIGPLLLVGGALVAFIGNVMAGFSRLLPYITRAGGVLNILRTGLGALLGPIGLVIGALTLLGIGFMTLYKKSDTFRNFINKTWDSIKTKAMEVFGFIRPYITAALSGVTTFIQQKLSQIKQFWSENGTQIMQALKNIWSVISGIFKAAMAVILPIVQVGLKLLKGAFDLVFPLILMLIRSVWNNIRGVIDGGLRVIMGLVKVFSGLFTGDFRKMFSGLKDIFFGSIQLIWNLVQLNMFGKLLGLGKIFIGGFKGIFIGLFNGLRSIFTSGATAAKNVVVGAWNLLFNITKGIFNAYKTIFTTVFNFLRTMITKSVSGTVNLVKGSFTLLRNITTNIFNGIRNFLSTMWTATRNKVTGLASGIRDGVAKSWTSLRNKTTEMFNGIKDKVKDIFSDLVESAKGLPKRIGDAIGSMAGKVKAGVSAVGNKLASQLETVVNAITQKGINVVLKKIGVDDKDKLLPELKLPRYKNGTKNGSHPGGLAVLGDGKKHELFRTPNGRVGLSPNTDTIMNLPKGTQVLSGEQTERVFSSLPMYSGGNGVKNAVKEGLGWLGDKKDKAVSKTKEVAGAAKDKVSGAIGDVWDYMSDPSKLMKKVWSTLNLPTFNAGGLLSSFAKSGITSIKDSAVGYVKKMMEEFMPSFGDGGGSNSVAQYYLDNFRVSTPFSPNKGLNDGWHSGGHKGIDLAGKTKGAALGKVIQSLTDGLVAQVLVNNPTAGNGVRIRSGNRTYSYIHMRDTPLVKKGQKVSMGETLGYIGSTGRSGGPHLDLKIQEDGKGYIDPLKVLKQMASSQGGGGSIGGSGVARWRPYILKAAAQMNEKISESDIKGILAQINRESTGNDKITQSSSVRDINTRNGNPARGLLQYIPQTFKKYAVKGYGDIYNGYHQLLAWFNNTKWRQNNPAGRSGWGPTGKRKYKNGTKFHLGGDAILGDGFEVEPFLLPDGQLGLSPDTPTLFKGLPTGTKVWSNVQDFVNQTGSNNKTDAMKLIALTAKGIEEANRQQASNTYVNQQTSDNKELSNKLSRIEEVLMLILAKNTSFRAEINERTLIDFIEDAQTDKINSYGRMRG